MRSIVGWYLSGFYKKPKGLKKPYNPILGETFRCYWQHPNGSRTFYIAEQVCRNRAVGLAEGAVSSEGSASGRVSRSVDCTGASIALLVCVEWKFRLLLVL